MTKTAALCWVVLPLLLPRMLLGQEPERVPLAFDYTVAGVRYDSAVPTPDAVLGYRIGTRHTRPHELVEYFRRMAGESDRVMVEEHGRTFEGRPLIHAYVSTPGNLARLAEIEAGQARLTDDPETVTDADLERMPAVVYMGYSIHGNEASGSEAAVLLLYHLAAGMGDPVESLLQHTVVILDPSFNPDGRDRFADWANGRRGAVATSDPADWEHDEPWPGGRTNHYWFDLNRDWLPGQMPESQGRLAVFHRWRPQLLTDYHEMGGNATFFFQPGIPSRNNPNTPPEVFRLTEALAQYHARALDRIGSLYYTKESFDDFYYGKGSTFPDVNGAVGILFEQASSRALITETAFGRLRYARTILNHFVASLSTLEGLRDLRLEFLRHQRGFYRGAVAVAGRFPVQAYVIGTDGDRTRAQELARTLQRHRIVVHRLAREVTAGGRRYRPGSSYIVPVRQPQARLIRAMMERVTSFQDSIFYDVSAWTFPLAFGVPLAELQDAQGLVGEALGPVEDDGGAVLGGKAEYAYVMEWGRYYGPRALYRLLAAGVHPLVATRPFTLRIGTADTRFAPGTIIIPLRGRDEDAPAPGAIHDLVASMAREDHVLLHAVSSGLSIAGPDLGGQSSRVVEVPTIGLVVGEGISSSEAGEIWHLLTERMVIPISLLPAATLGRVDLSRYNRLILPSGFSADSTVAKRLEDWAVRGGVLLAQRTAARWVIQSGIVDEQMREIPRDTLRVAYAELDAARGSQQVGGAIVEAAVDSTHPLAFGYGARVPLFRSGTLYFEPSIAAGATVARYTDAPLLSGYLSAANLEHLRGSAAILARRRGQGAVILLADDVNFRAFWYGTNGLFMNALLFGGVF